MYKMLVVGSAGVGKSSLLVRFVVSSFDVQNAYSYPSSLGWLLH